MNVEITVKPGEVITNDTISVFDEVYQGVDIVVSSDVRPDIIIMLKWKHDKLIKEAS